MLQTTDVRGWAEDAGAIELSNAAQLQRRLADWSSAISTVRELVDRDAVRLDERDATRFAELGATAGDPVS